MLGKFFFTDQWIKNNVKTRNKTLKLTVLPEAEAKGSWHISCNSHSFRRPGWRSRYSDTLWAGRSGERIPAGTRFPAPVQTGPGENPTSYTIGTMSLPGVKRPGRGVDHPTRSSAEVKEIKLNIYSPSGP